MWSKNHKVNYLDVYFWGVILIALVYAFFSIRESKLEHDKFRYAVIALPALNVEVHLTVYQESAKEVYVNVVPRIEYQVFKKMLLSRASSNYSITQLATDYRDCVIKIKRLRRIKL